MTEKTMQVITRPRTMSGRKGGLTLTLPRVEAEDMIAKRWADPVPPLPVETAQTENAGERAARAKGKAS